MVSKGTQVAIVVLAVAAVGGAVYVVTRAKGTTPPPQLAALSLNASATSGTAPLVVAFSGVGTNPSGGPVQGVTIYFFVNNALVSFANPVVTAADGSFSFNYTFSSPGTYVCFVSDNPQGSGT